MWWSFSTTSHCIGDTLRRAFYKLLEQAKADGLGDTGLNRAASPAARTRKRPASALDCTLPWPHIETAIPNTEQDEQEQSQAEFCADGTAMNNALFGVAPAPANAAQATPTVHSGSEQSDLPAAVPHDTANNGTTSNMAPVAVVGRGRRSAGRRCAICGQTGHNRRTCPALRGEEEEGCSEDSSEASSEDEYHELDGSSTGNEGSTDDEEQDDVSSTDREEEDERTMKQVPAAAKRRAPMPLIAWCYGSASENR